jgi:hypothetical protein
VDIARPVIRRKRKNVKKDDKASDPSNDIRVS